MNAVWFLFTFAATSLVLGADVCKDDLTVTYVNSLTASSEMDPNDKSTNYAAERAILNTMETKDAQGIMQQGSWVAEKNNFNQWIQVELKDMALIRGIISQGRNGCCQDWVTKYRVLYSADCHTWDTVQGFNVTDAFFQANTDQDTQVTNMFRCPVMAKCIRINPLGYNGNMAMRVGVLGCPLTLKPSTTTAAPTQAPVTTAAPTQAPITTQAPTQAPITTPAPTKAAKTQAPTTQAPTTQAPTTQAPTTAAPTAAPTTQAPITSATTKTKAPVATQRTAAPPTGSPNSNGAGSGVVVKGCINSCKNLPNGDYPSCSGCTFYSTCVWGTMYDPRACPHGLAWDNKLKRCDKKSSTCP